MGIGGQVPRSAREGAVASTLGSGTARSAPFHLVQPPQLAHGSPTERLSKSGNRPPSRFSGDSVARCDCHDRLQPHSPDQVKPQSMCANSSTPCAMGAVTQRHVSLSFCRVHAVAERVVRTRFDSFKPACTLTSASLAPPTSLVKMHAHRLHATSQQVRRG